MGGGWFTVERFGVGNEKQACEWLLGTRPQARPNKLMVFLADGLLDCQRRLFAEMNILVGIRSR